MDHAWTRRSFMSRMGLAAVGGSMALGGRSARAFDFPQASRLASQSDGRILVLVELNGGNDGLNTIVPVDNPIYYNQRPKLSVAKSDTISFSSDLHVHPNLAPLQSHFDKGHMAVVQNVGYEQPDLSHFRSMDIWMSGTDSSVYDPTGWVGRYLHGQHPGLADNPTSVPLAVQIGGNSFVFDGPEIGMGMSLTSADAFDRIVETGQLYDASSVPQGAYGDEVRFMRRIANDTFRYASTIQEAAARGGESSSYYPPEGDNYLSLGRDLSIVAQLIKGELGTKIFMVTLGGFDTHGAQEGLHPQLLEHLSQSIDGFLQDLDDYPGKEDVLVMTFSEFGRRVRENSSDGTDHGTGAPLFLFGPQVNPGLHGTAPRLDNLDVEGNVFFDIGFRDIYSTVLQNWFGLGAYNTADILGGVSSTLPILDSVGQSTSRGDAPGAARLHLGQNYPNPARDWTTLSVELPESGPVAVELFDMAGRRLRTVMKSHLGAGGHSIPMTVSDLAAGSYVVKLTSRDGVRSIVTSVLD